jgi:ABC transporter substrate binding protein (PQQ-dependent alcohol dehydrogenase system)
MTERDYAGWLAITAIAEAANRTGASDAAALFSYLTGDQFQLAGFKGEALSFRAWDGQMRQPILLAGSRLLVSVSPQPGFLQKGSDLDSLGDAAEENRCAR